MSSNPTLEPIPLEEHAPPEPLERRRTDRIDRLQARFDTALQSWDAHMRGCHECLSYGLHLCAEGVFVAADVGVARESLVRLTTKLARRSGVTGRVPVASKGSDIITGSPV